MYYKDLTPYSYGFDTDFNVVNIGWLSNKYTFNQTGTLSPLFINNLEKITALGFYNHMRGSHTCEFCQNKHEYNHLEYNGKKIFLGNGEIWIPDVNTQRVFVSPSLLWHYIKEHNYIPPIEFIESCERFDFNSDWNPQTIISIEHNKMWSKTELVGGPIYYTNTHKEDDCNV